MQREALRRAALLASNGGAGSSHLRLQPRRSARAGDAISAITRPTPSPRWAGARLPTEFEWEASGRSAAMRSRGNFSSTTRRARRCRAATASPLFGDVLAMDPLGLPALSAASARPKARSANTTASSCPASSCCAAARCATVRGHSRASYRNFFYPHQRWQFTGCGWRRTSDGSPPRAWRWSSSTRTGSPRRFAPMCSPGSRSRRKAVPARWLYDEAGSRLFEAITRLPEYYPTRAETEILAERCGDFRH